MERVFLVTSGHYSDYSIEAAFSSEANAQQYIDDADSEWWASDDPRIEEFVIDEWQSTRQDDPFWHVTFYDPVRATIAPVHRDSLGAPTLLPTSVAVVPDDETELLPAQTVAARLSYRLYRDEWPPALGVNEGTNMVWYHHDGPHKGMFDAMIGGQHATKVPQHYWNANVAAPDEETAIKIAAEQVAQVKARQAGIA